MKTAMSRPVWAEIDLGAIRHNVGILKERNGERALMAVVKANGYGHGAVQVAKAALEAGATWLGVALPEEGVELRQAGIDAPILVLGAFYPGTEDVYYEWKLIATLATPEGLQALCLSAQRGRPIAAHIKVDTGMGRLGFLPHDVTAAIRAAAAAGAPIEGAYTHLSTADAEDVRFALAQMKTFQSVLQEIAATGVKLQWRHVGNSAALLQLPLGDTNLSRAGIALYGLPPSSYLAGKAPLRPAMSLHTRVVSVRRLPPNSPISYGALYVTSRDTNIAALPIGYADGYTHRLTNPEALLHGRRFPVVGAICMDQCMVDVGDEPVAVGEEVVLLGRQGDAEITAEELAAKSGTMNYEIVCGISNRVRRVWV